MMSREDLEYYGLATQKLPHFPCGVRVKEPSDTAVVHTVPSQIATEVEALLHEQIDGVVDLQQGD